jgi:hypothetical protein
MVIAGILLIITAVLVMLMRNVDGICFDGFKPICRNDSGSVDVKGLHNNIDSYDFNRRYLNIKVDSISYDCSNSRSCEAKENNGESGSSQYARRCIQNSRNLREYNKEDVVRCLDDLSIKKNRRPMHIAFIGDSTVRQHFFSFIRVKFDKKLYAYLYIFRNFPFMFFYLCS